MQDGCWHKRFLYLTGHPLPIRCNQAAWPKKRIQRTRQVDKWWAQIDHARLVTCIIDDESRIAHGGVASESQEQAVAAALDPLGQLGPVEAPDQGAERIRPVVDVKEVIPGLQIKPGKQQRSDDCICKSSVSRCRSEHSPMYKTRQREISCPTDLNI